MQFGKKRKRQKNKRSHKRLPLRKVVSAMGVAGNLSDDDPDMPGLLSDSDDESDSDSGDFPPSKASTIRNQYTAKHNSRRLPLRRPIPINIASPSAKEDSYMAEPCDSVTENDSEMNVDSTKFDSHFDVDAELFDDDLFDSLDDIFDEDYALLPSSAPSSPITTASSNFVPDSPSITLSPYSPAAITFDLQESAYVRYLRDMKKKQNKRIQTILSRVSWVLIFIMQHEESATTSYTSLASVVSDLILTKHIVLPDACTNLEKRKHRLPGTIAAYLMDTYGFCKWFTVYSRENIQLGMHRIQNAHLLNMQTMIQDLASEFRKQVR